MMVVSDIHKVFPTIKQLRGDDLKNGLDLSILSYRAYSSFLNKLEKLIAFDEIIFKCIDDRDNAYTLTTVKGE